MRALVFLALLTFSFGVLAQARPTPAPPPEPHPTPAPVPYNGRMTNATVGVVEHKMGKLGFAANDPRYRATEAAVFGGITAGAATAGTMWVAGALGLGVAAVSWPVVLVAAGVGALVSGITSLAQSGVNGWVFDVDEGLVIIEPESPWLSEAVPGTCWVRIGGTCDQGGHVYSSIGAAASTVASSGWRAEVGACYMRGPSLACPVYSIRESDGYQSNVVSTFLNASHPTNPNFTDWNDPKPEKQIGHIHDIYEMMDEAAKRAPVNPELIAGAANAMWQDATLADPNIIPWSPSNPITVQDVQEWRTANPDSYPSVSDFVSQIAPPGSSSVPRPGTSTNPSPNPNPNPNPDPGTNPNPNPLPDPTPGFGMEVDLGPDPNVPAPGLEPIPTAQMILDPILSVRDRYQFEMPQRQGECPVANFDLFGEGYTIDSHCALFEQNREMIRLAMMALFSLLAVLVVLRA